MQRTAIKILSSCTLDRDSSTYFLLMIHTFAANLLTIKTLTLEILLASLIPRPFPCWTLITWTVKKPRNKTAVGLPCVCWDYMQTGSSKYNKHSYWPIVWIVLFPTKLPASLEKAGPKHSTSATTVHLKVKGSPGQVGGAAVNCPVTSPGEKKMDTWQL